MKLSQKLIFGFVSVALLVAVVGYTSVRSSQKALQQSIGENTVSLAVEAMDKIDRSIYYRIEEFQLYSKDLTVWETATRSNQEFEKLDDIQSYIREKDKEWTSAPKEEITPFMGGIINNELAGELKEKIESYEEKFGYKVIPEMYVTNKYGVVIASSGRTSDYFQADEQWYQKAVAEKAYWVGDTEYDESSDAYASDIVVSLYDDKGDFSGIVKATLNIEEIINIVKKIEATRRHHATEFKLATRDGRIIYSTEDFKFFEDVSEELLSRLKQKEDHQGYFISKGDKPGEGEELYVHAHSKGYKDFKGLGWILAVEHETEEIFAPVAKLRTRILIISAAITALAVLLGLFISKTISRPIGNLATAAAKIGEGKLDTRLEVRSKDEVGQLANSFNKMAEDLQNTTTSIGNLNAANQQLQASEQQLKAVNQQLCASEVQLRALNHNLGERMKELGCLYRVSSFATEVKKSMDDIFTEAVDLIPPSWRYPEITCARIAVNGQEFMTDNFEETEWKQSADIVVSEGKIGSVEVYYLQDKPVIDEGPFLKEERHLIDALSRQLGIIFERKKAEEALEVSNRDLEQAASKLEELNRELKDFVYIASHDLREPLRKISSFGELLKDSLSGNLNADDQENLKFMIDGAKRMTAMIEGLLVYSRLSKNDAAFKAVDLNEIVEQLEQLELAELLEETDAAIEVSQPLPKVQAEPVQVRQLLQNLIANGIKYRREGIQPQVVIRAKQIADGRVRVEVQDNGIGIAKEYEEDVFKMFKRLHSRKEYEGTGIGLAVCKKIVERHNGQIGIESEAGAGSTFWFTLPVSESSGQEQKKLVSSLET